MFKPGPTITFDGVYNRCFLSCRFLQVSIKTHTRIPFLLENKRSNTYISPEHGTCNAVVASRGTDVQRRAERVHPRTPTPAVAAARAAGAVHTHLLCDNIYAASRTQQQLAHPYISRSSGQMQGRHIVLVRAVYIPATPGNASSVSPCASPVSSAEGSKTYHCQG